MHQDPLKRLTLIQSEIASLRAEGRRILEALAAEFGSPERTVRPAAAAAPIASEARKGPRRARRGAPRGSLAPAVLQVLRNAPGPLRAAEIFDGLKAANYAFTGAHPKRSLVARLYKLPGVQSQGSGLFALTPSAGTSAPAPAPDASPTAS